MIKVKITNPADANKLFDAKAYAEQLKKDGH